LDSESHKAIVDSIKPKVELYHSNFFVRNIRKYIDDLKTFRKVKSVLRKNKLPELQRKLVLTLVKNEMSLNRRIDSLVLMQNLFKYWHVAHLPFALVMLVIMIIHVAVTIVFGYRWIF
jgi:hypothetical protein